MPSSESTSLLKNQEMRSSVTMQAYPQMPPVGLQLHAPQQTSCSRVPSPTAQVQYYIAQQRMANEQNKQNQPSHGLWNSQTSSQIVSSSSSLQSRQMLQAWLTDSQNQMLHRNSSSTLPNGQFVPLAAAQHGNPTQHLSLHPQTLNRNTVPQQNYNMPPLHRVSSTANASWFASVNNTAGSATEQDNLMHQSVLDQYPSFGGHTNRMQITHQPAAQPQQTGLSVQTNHTQQQIQNNQSGIKVGKGNGASYSSLHHLPATSQRLITPSQPSYYSHQTGHSHSSCNGNQDQHSSQIQHQHPSYRAENNCASYGNLKHHRNELQSLMSKLRPPYTSHNFANQGQPNQRVTHSSAFSLPQDNIQLQTPLQQCNTRPVSGHHSKACHPTVCAIQGNTQPQVLQLNNSITGLPRSSQVTISSSTPTSETPTSTCTEPTLNYSQVTLMDLLVKDNTHVLAQKHDASPLSFPKANFTTQGPQPSHIITKASYSQTPESAPNYSAATLYRTELHRFCKNLTPAQKTAILKLKELAQRKKLKAPNGQSFEGMLSRRLQTDSNTERTDGHVSNNRHGEVQNSEDEAGALQLVLEMKKVLQQFHKAVAVVPPISQQVPSPGKDDPVTKSSVDSLPFKISAVWSLVKESKDGDQESNASTAPKETTEESLQFSSVPHPEKQESNKHENGSTVDCLISDTQSAEISQSKIDSTTFQVPVCATDLTSKSSEDQNKVKTDESNDTILDLSKVQTYNFTCNKFIYWVNILEHSTSRRDNEPVPDVGKCILDLYWNGSIENLVKHLYVLNTELTGLCSKISIDEIQAANFQYLKPKDLKMLAHGNNILKNDTNVPTEEFKSSWLNLNGQPADIETVLAEPILDFTLTDYALHRDLDTLNTSTESDPSTKVILAATDSQSEKMINKEIVNSQVCESKPADKVSNTQGASTKQDEENLEEHQQQDVNLNPEESVDSNEITDTLMKIKSKTECEQVCSDATILQQCNTKPVSVHHSKTYHPTIPAIQENTQPQALQLNNSTTGLPSSSQVTISSSTPTSEAPPPTCTESTLDNSLMVVRDSHIITKLNYSQTPESAPNGGASSIICSKTDEDEILERSEGDLSNDFDSSNDSQLISFSLLSADDAKTIFKEYSGCDLKKEPSQLCQDETKVLDIKSNGCCNSAKQIKFTCPHLTDTFWEGEHFCSRCWEETPLLDLDLEEALFSPKGDTLNIITPPKQDHHNQSFSQQSGKPGSNCTVFSENSSIADSLTPNVDVFEETVSEPDPNPSVPVENCTSLSGKATVKELCAPMCHVSVAMPIEEQVCETNISVGPLPKALTYAQNIENLVIPEQTKSPRDEVSPINSPPCKKLKLAKTVEIPAKDDLFTTDIVTKKATSTKPHAADLSVTPAEDVLNCKDERKVQGEERKASNKLKVQINAQCSSGKPDPNVTVCSGSSNSSSPSAYGVNVSVKEPDSYLGDAAGKSSQSGKSPYKEKHGQVFSEGVTLPIEKQVYEADSLSGADVSKAQSLAPNTEKRKLVNQTMTSRHQVSQPKYPSCKKRKVTKTLSICADDLFAPDVVVKKASSPKAHPSDLNVPLIEGGQHCKDEWKEGGKDRKSPIMLKVQLGQHSGQTKAEAHGKWKTISVKDQVPNVTPQLKRPAVVANSDTNKEKVLCKKSGPEQKRVKMRFALFGFESNNVQHRCPNKTKPYTAPAYITISNCPKTGNSYTDMPSAKQKVYSQWSSTFVETNKNTSSHKKQKNVKIVLKSKTKALKRQLEDRINSKKQMVQHPSV